MFSIILTFPENPGHEWVDVTAEPLVADAPGAEALAPGAKLVILDGRRIIAELVLATD